MLEKLTLAVLLLGALSGRVVAVDELAEGFRAPPREARPRVYWWWLNNLVSREGITRDLEQFRAKGIGGVLLFNAGAPAGKMPSGPDFMSPEWRELVKHAVREADRLGLEVSLNLCSGWDAGGPWITDETASHHYVQAELNLTGPLKFSGRLPQPPGPAQAYHDVAVQAFPRAVLGTRPFRVEISGAVQPADNLLEITVTNLWPNRLIGDAALPPEKRFTRTHVTKFTKDAPLLPSGLLGPVQLTAEE